MSLKYEPASKPLHMGTGMSCYPVDGRVCFHPIDTVSWTVLLTNRWALGYLCVAIYPIDGRVIFLLERREAASGRHAGQVCVANQ